MQRRSFLKAAGAAGAAAALAGCIGSVSGSADYDVAMRSNAFVPADGEAVTDFSDAPDYVPTDVPTVEVAVGETVTWLNTGTRYHTVTGASAGMPEDADYFASGGFENEKAALDSFEKYVGGGGAIAPSETYTHVFDTSGWYHYYCIPHLPAGMVGNVKVIE